jgi:hypothetical protein
MSRIQFAASFLIPELPGLWYHDPRHTNQNAAEETIQPWMLDLQGQA